MRRAIRSAPHVTRAMWWRRSLVAATAVLICVTGFLLHNPVPDGTSEPHKLRVLQAPFKLTALLGDLLEPYFGSRFRLCIIRFMISVGHAVKPKPPEYPSLTITNATFDGVAVVVYQPDNLPTNGPGLVYFHGGGWSFGSTALYDGHFRRFAHRLTAVVIAVSYRLSPENSFPVPLDDCRRATTHFLSRASEFGVDADRVAVAGDSSGGNLAAAVAISLRDEHFSPLPKLQVLIYPALQAVNFQTLSYMQHQNNVILPRLTMVSCWLWYAFGHAEQREIFLENEHTSPEIKVNLSANFINPADLSEDSLTLDHHTLRATHGNSSLWAEIETLFMNPLFSPLLAKDVSGLPAAYILTVEQDVLRDDGVWFARRLAEAGVLVEHSHLKNGFHGMLAFDRLQDSKSAFERIISFVKENL